MSEPDPLPPLEVSATPEISTSPKVVANPEDIAHEAVLAREARAQPAIPGPPFKAAGPGTSLEIDAVRTAIVFKGEDESVVLIWHNGPAKTVVRLSKEAAQATATLLLYATGGVVMDVVNQPPLI